ncbi:protein containing ATP-binding region, ATPase-like domain, partial [sediment metagenome]
LGLSLVKTIAERHGGHVRCEGREGGGARFVVELPL